MTAGPNTALIVGVGPGLGAALARRAAREGMRVAIAARDGRRLTPIAERTGAMAYSCDAVDSASVADLFDRVEAEQGPLSLVIYNASQRVRGPITELDPGEVERVFNVTAFGGFNVAQQAAKRMAPRRSGSILITGASASVKGFPLSSPFAMGKFALRGLAQSLARELAPQGVHVAHFVIDGGIDRPDRDPGTVADSWLDPDAIADSYFHVHNQPRNAWTWEVELRPWVERF
jgi:NAD(P)-dependent dehydrogenase (short-subunit alcohol dehydrogenase family)